MPFRFTLESVLRYRRCLEDREQMRLYPLLAKRAAWQQELQRLGDGRRRLQTVLHQDMQRAPVAAIEVHLCMANLRGMESREALLQSQLHQLQTEIDQQTARYQQERRKREVMEALRDTQSREYSLQRQRREQARLDELHLLRRGRGQA